MIFNSATRKPTDCFASLILAIVFALLSAVMLTLSIGRTPSMVILGVTTPYLQTLLALLFAAACACLPTTDCFPLRTIRLQTWIVVLLSPFITWAVASPDTMYFLLCAGVCITVFAAAACCLAIAQKNAWKNTPHRVRAAVWATVVWLIALTLLLPGLLCAVYAVARMFPNPSEKTRFMLSSIYILFTTAGKGLAHCGLLTTLAFVFMTVLSLQDLRECLQPVEASLAEAEPSVTNENPPSPEDDSHENDTDCGA